MLSDSDLLHIHVAALFVLDEKGDLVSTNEPYVSGRRPAPAFFLGWSKEDYVCRFRHDVPDGMRREVKDLIAGSWPFADAKHPPDVESIKAVLSPYAPAGKAGSGPAYVFPDPIEPQGEATLVGRSGVHVLASNFADTILTSITFSRAMWFLRAMTPSVSATPSVALRRLLKPVWRRCLLIAEEVMHRGR